MMSLDTQANVIKISAIVVAMPRWIGALLDAEGVPLPPEWKPAWRIFSFVMSAGMAIVEAMAFSFVFQAWRDEKDEKRSNKLMALAILSAVAFVSVLSPYIYSSVRSVPISEVLSEIPLWGWSIAVAASTILIVMSVGYSQKMPREKRTATQDAKHGATNAKQEESIANAPVVASAPNAIPDATQETHDAEVKTQVCRICAEGFSNAGKLAAHMRWQHASRNGHSEHDAIKETSIIGG